jgi:hypothetical protein
MLTLDSKFSEFIDLCRKHGACEDAFTWMQGEIDKDKKIIFGKAMEDYLADEKGDPGYASWILKVAGNELDEEIRKGFIAKIKDPMDAMRIHLDCAFLTDEEDKLLETKFIKDGKHLLPTVEKELAAGVVVRAKVKA